MADVVKLNDDDLDSVSGGALMWAGGRVYPMDDPSAVYRFRDYDACSDYIRANWPGGAQNEDTLKMLEAVGLVWRE